MPQNSTVELFSAIHISSVEPILQTQYSMARQISMTLFLLVTHFFVGQNLMARHHFKLYSRKKLILKMQNSSNRQNLYLHSLMMPPILRMFIFHKSQYSQSTYILITITPRIAITFMHHFHTKLIPQNIISWFLRKASFQSLAVIYPSKIITTRFQKVP